MHQLHICGLEALMPLYGSGLQKQRHTPPPLRVRNRLVTVRQLAKMEQTVKVYSTYFERLHFSLIQATAGHQVINQSFHHLQHQYCCYLLTYLLTYLLSYHSSRQRHTCHVTCHPEGYDEIPTKSAGILWDGRKCCRIPIGTETNKNGKNRAALP